eukprot:5093411-Pyramimonas_sp.AAC.1
MPASPSNPSMRAITRARLRRSRRAFGCDNACELLRCMTARWVDGNALVMSCEAIEKETPHRPSRHATMRELMVAASRRACARPPRA